ncbi:hypothetical protein PTKU46_58660 [Paraburkholderia terrae]|uniref:lecithin retinol acyltransferase family protein n=1 Tax=Paraburkholderia terrae TaxID=311230 RepID=UPI0030E57393
MGFWDSIEDTLSGLKDAARSLPAILKDPNDLSLLMGNTVKLPKLPSTTLSLKRGDVIKVARLGGIYEHYGVFVSQESVIHFSNQDGPGEISGENRIIDTPLKVFMGDAKKVNTVSFPKSPFEKRTTDTFVYRSFGPQQRRFDWNFLKYKHYSPDEIVERAKGRLGTGGYNLLWNNCEHFAVWCATGVKESEQVTGGRSFEITLFD